MMCPILPNPLKNFQFMAKWGGGLLEGFFVCQNYDDGGKGVFEVICLYAAGLPITPIVYSICIFLEVFLL